MRRNTLRYCALRVLEMDASDLAVRVECYAGHRGEETPRRFHLGTRAVDVVDVLDRWLSPDHRYFKVRGDDDASYILRHDVATDRWELTLFDRTPDRLS